MALGAANLRLSAAITFPRNLRVDFTNEKPTVAAMAGAIKRVVKARAARGVDAHGRQMPKPKDAGTPQNPRGTAYRRSGTLVGNIVAAEKKTRRKPKPGQRKRPVTFVIKSAGPRPKDENVAAKKKRMKARTKELRAAAVVGEAFGALGTGRDISPAFARKKRGAGIKLTRLRVRTADTNAALAGILSVKPKDKRSKRGGRKQYRVFEATDEYANIAAGVMRQDMKYELSSHGKIKLRSK